jgi:hypothetical protein
VARIRLDPWKSVRPFKGIFCDDISEFESSLPSQAVGLHAQRVKNGRISGTRDDAGRCPREPDEATPDGNNSLYCFNFLTQRDLAADPNGVLA